MGFYNRSRKFLNSKTPGSIYFDLFPVYSMSGGLVAMWILMSVGLFNSRMFPTIFSLALDGLGNDRPQGSGVLCAMMVGDALILPAFDYLTDSFGFNTAFLIVIVS